MQENRSGRKIHHERESRLSLEEFIEKAPDFTTGERIAVREILESVAEGGREVSHRLALGPLHGLTGSSGQVNVQGEEVQAFDEIAQEVFSGLLGASGRVSVLVSEEREKPEVFPCPTDSFYVAMDPLDGSSNLAVSGPVGSIFALYRSRDGNEDPSRAILESVQDVVCAVYVLYSVSTLMVVAFREEVRMYALDPASGGFLPLPGPVRFPDGGGQIVSINTANYTRWDRGVQAYVDTLHSHSSWSARYVGALVMDFHRNLLKGGIYIYPGDLPKGNGGGHPEGKLRLLFEAIPMAFIARAAGGLATNGQKPILELPATHIHQRVALIVGSRERVQEFSRISGSPEPN
ncbi:MAG: fructose-1,6-bisphosphatase [Nitrospirae bacterium]|nr:fructose-1,6-bisphosphatase [Nitrospirota bacterium]